MDSTKTVQKTGWDAFGFPVPESRLVAAFAAVKEMAPSLKTKARYSIVFKCAKYIKQDQPFKIVGAIDSLDKDLDKIDLTGRYRLLATLLTD